MIITDSNSSRSHFPEMSSTTVTQSEMEMQKPRNDDIESFKATGSIS